jgi:hypothetical protein
MDASSIIAPGTVCGGYAEVAPPHPNGNSLAAVDKPTTLSAEKKKDEEQIPGGEFSLPDHPADFVEGIHRNTDLFIAWRSLLNSTDLKIRQRAVEKLTEMRYKGAGALADEPQQIVIDIDSAVARRAAEGARK